LLWSEFVDEVMDWPIESSGAARLAFARGIASRPFASNRFGAIHDDSVNPSP
jgi:hypothetical protein